jgi:hypothetical protein
VANGVLEFITLKQALKWQLDSICTKQISVFPESPFSVVKICFSFSDLQPVHL